MKMKKMIGHGVLFMEFIALLGFIIGIRFQLGASLDYYFVSAVVTFILAWRLYEFGGTNE